MPGSGEGRFPPGGNLGALSWSKEKKLPGEFTILAGVCVGGRGAVRKELGGSRPTVAERVAGELGLRKAGLSSSIWISYWTGCLQDLGTWGRAALCIS